MQSNISLATISKWVNQFQQNKEILKERKKRKDFELNKFKKPLERENYLLKKRKWKNKRWEWGFKKAWSSSKDKNKNKHYKTNCFY
ncbi:hypothetical protein [Spiroplasma endosymbiont of Polydrusus pterygomalis]|uniref:hypothetical protein n=1 Tax=Spiroplasma endosymbiont of Polydrusus pterygomalis TaxID=3139327 RepID=UPI003CCAC083